MSLLLDWRDGVYNGLIIDLKVIAPVLIFRASSSFSSHSL